MGIDPAEFRRILGHWTSGVTVVATVSAAGEPRGLTASAVASLSLVPPLVLACVDRDSDSYPFIIESRIFSVNVLAQAGERIARRFAGSDATGKFAGIAWAPRVTGAPVLDEALAWVDCRLRDVYDGGDHSIFVGEVVAGDAREDQPLVYYRGGFHRLTS